MIGTDIWFYDSWDQNTNNSVCPQKAVAPKDRCRLDYLPLWGDPQNLNRTVHCSRSRPTFSKLARTTRLYRLHASLHSASKGEEAPVSLERHTPLLREYYSVPILVNDGRHYYRRLKMIYITAQELNLNFRIHLNMSLVHCVSTNYREQILAVPSGPGPARSCGRRAAWFANHERPNVKANAQGSPGYELGFWATKGTPK